MRAGYGMDPSGSTERQQDPALDSQIARDTTDQRQSKERPMAHEDRPSTAPRVAEFLRTRSAAILAAWERSQRALPQYAQLPSAELVDSMPRLLLEIADAAEQPRLAPFVPGAPAEHALVRIEGGFSLGDVLLEYATLRECVLSAMDDEDEQISVRELRHLARALDRAMLVTADRYAASRDRLLRALDLISSETIGRHDLNALLDALVAGFMEAVPTIDTANILLYDKGRLYVRATRGLEAEANAGFSVALGEGFAGAIAQERAPLFLEKGSRDPRIVSPWLREKNLKILYGVPLVQEGTLVGVAHIGSARASHFNPDDLLLFRTLATRAAALLVQARLLEEVEAEQRRFRLGLRGSRVSVFEQDRDLRYRWLYNSLLTSDPQKFLGRTDHEIVERPEDADRPVAIKRRVMETGEPALEQVEVTARGSKLVLRLAVEPLIVRGVVDGVVCSAADITDEQRNAEYQQRMIGILGHDLRNPLSAIALATKHLLRRENLDDAQLRTLTRITRATDRMFALIGDMVDFTRARTGGIPVHPAELAVDDVIDAIVEEASTGHPERHFVFAERASCRASLDPERLKQALANILENAARYGTPGSPVTVRARCDGEHVVISVHNQGEPIPEALRPVMFEPFRRGRSEGGGVGLGLFITAEIARAHGGTVTVSSDAEEGTVFTLRLPRTAAAIDVGNGNNR